MSAQAAEITNAELALFCRQFGSLVHAQVNILQVLEALRNQASKAYFREIIDQVRRDIEMGRSLATAFSRYPQTFSPFFISMIRQGELEGELDQALFTLAEHFEARLDREVDSTRQRASGAYDVETLISVLRYVMVWGAAFLSAIFIAAALIWQATNLEVFPPNALGPAVFFVTGLVLFLGVLLFSRHGR